MILPHSLPAALAAQHVDLRELLEPEQLAEARARSLPRKRLQRAEIALLVLLRIYVFVAVPLVIYAFVHAVYGR
ncbi:MAG: hypothetical protein ACREM2_01440 [Vulcanimicrobiaceae bacterium]